MYILLEISMIFERLNICNCLEHDESIGDENIRTRFGCVKNFFGAGDFQGFANHICEDIEKKKYF